MLAPMLALALTPAVLFALVLAAHFLRSGQPVCRLAVIIGSVIAVALLGAALAGTRRVIERAREAAGSNAA
jgi:hypothetical protein